MSQQVEDGVVVAWDYRLARHVLSLRMKLHHCNLRRTVEPLDLQLYGDLMVDLATAELIGPLDAIAGASVDGPALLRRRCRPRSGSDPPSSSCPVASVGQAEAGRLVEQVQRARPR